MHPLSRMLGYFASSPLPPKLAEQPTVDVALSEGDLPLAVEPSAVVLVGYLWASEGASPVNCQMLAGTSPMKRTWMMAAVSERGRYG